MKLHGDLHQVRSNNVTVSGTEVGGVGNKQLMRNKGNGKRKAKDVAAEWQAALGPYPVVSPGTRWEYLRIEKTFSE